MDTICQRFIHAEQDFLLAAQSDDQLLADFAECWQTLQSDWEDLRPKADSNTRQLVDTVAKRIEELAGDLYLVKSRTISLEDDLLSGLEEVFTSLSLEDRVVIPTESVSETTIPGQSPSPVHDPISPSQWLLGNLHNPYPLPHIQFMERTAGSKYVKDWFAKARQRIGWTRLLRDRFAGCRSLAINAAFRAFVRDDPHNPLEADLKTAFLAIKSHAELVYGDERMTSSPKRPRSISPTPSLTFSSTSEDSDDERSLTPPSKSPPGRPSKRASPDYPDSSSPTLKRRRTHNSQLSHQSQAQIVISPACVEPSSPCPKKRRLSESDSDLSRPKRPRGTAGGRLHAASDPISVPSMPAWFDFDQSFKIPTPASTNPLDSSSFDLYFLNPLPSCTVSSIPSEFIPFSQAEVSPDLSRKAPSIDVAVPASDFSALFEIPQLDLSQPGIPDFDSGWTEFLNFEPDFSLSPYSHSPVSSWISTPPLADDIILSPRFPSEDSFSPCPLPKILPCPNEKGIQFPTVREPVIQEQDFLLPPGEGAGIPSITAFFPIY